MGPSAARPCSCRKSWESAWPTNLRKRPGSRSHRRRPRHNRKQLVENLPVALAPRATKMFYFRGQKPATTKRSEGCGRGLAGGKAEALGHIIMTSYQIKLPQ